MAFAWKQDNDCVPTAFLPHKCASWLSARLHKMKLELGRTRLVLSKALKYGEFTDPVLTLGLSSDIFAGVCWSVLWKYTEHKMRSPHCRATQLPTGTRLPLPTLSTIGWFVATWCSCRSRERAKLPANFCRWSGPCASCVVQVRTPRPMNHLFIYLFFNKNVHILTTIGDSHNSAFVHKDAHCFLAQFCYVVNRKLPGFSEQVTLAAFKEKLKASAFFIFYRNAQVTCQNDLVDFGIIVQCMFY